MNNFNPTPISPFRWWVQMALPTAYDDSLSYYELLNKVVAKLNETINAINITESAVAQLRAYMQEYTENIDATIAQTIDDKLDDMVTSGELTRMVFNYAGYVTPQMFGAVADGATYCDSEISDCLNYAYSHQRAVYFPPGQYLIQYPIFRTGIVNIEMDGTLIYGGSGTAMTLIPDQPAERLNNRFRLKIARPTNTENPSRNNVGIEIRNISSSDIIIEQCDYYDIGLYLHALNNDCLLNNIHITDIKASTRCIYLQNDTHACNGNNIYGGYLRLTHPSIGNSYAIEIQGGQNTVFGSYVEGKYDTTTQASVPWNAAILFSGTAYKNYAIISTEHCPYSSKTINNSTQNVVQLLRGSGQPSNRAISDGTFASYDNREQYIYEWNNFFSREIGTIKPAEIFFSAAHNEANDKIAFGGCNFIKSNDPDIGSTANTRIVTKNSISLTNQQITLPSGNWLFSFDVDSTTAKQFLIKSDFNSNIIIKIYDENGDPITDVSGENLKVAYAENTNIYSSTAYGGSYTVVYDPYGRSYSPFTVTAAVKSIKIIMPNAHPFSYISIYTTPYDFSAIIKNYFELPFVPQNIMPPGTLAITTTGDFISDGATWHQLTLTT